MKRLLTKAVGTPLMSALKALDMVTQEDILKAIDKAAIGHRRKWEVKRMLANKDEYATRILADITDGTYLRHISYRGMVKVNPSGKQRDILSPSLYTRVLQLVWMSKVQPLYDARDNLIGLNCKKGCGLNARKRNRSVLHLLKHLMYDRRDLQYGLVIDQRQCYAHVSRKVMRRKIQRLCKEKWLTEFGMNVIFSPDGQFPIGTPSSPLAHHIMMMDFDHMCHSFAPVVIRYADNVLLAAQTKEELQQAKWRIKNWWWYDLGIRAKREDTRIFPLSEGIDFCGYVVHRNDRHGVCRHDKGYTTLRRSTAARARKCNNDKSWASYYGVMKHADAYRFITNIEKKMKLQELSAKIRINRKMDARKIDVRDLAESHTVFTIYDYEIRRDREGNANWMKCLIGIREPETGRMLAREFHGNYSCLIEAMEVWENTFGRDQMMPIEEVTIENQCGYIFTDSTNQLKYIDDDYRQSDCA